MRRLFVAALLFSGLISGWSRNYFNVPADNFAEKVKVLGVVPIIVDADSDISHPQKDQLIQIVTEANRKYEQQLVRRLSGTGSFFTVALMDGDPAKIFSTLLFRRERRDDATIQYNKYFYNNDELRDYIKKNSLDAVMLIVISGITRPDKVYSNELFTSLTSDYNFLAMSAQILDSTGTVLWEYPNFRKHIMTYNPMINLQYPDFSETKANLSGSTNLKFKTLEGIQRTIDKKRKDLLLRETQETEMYGKQFDEMLDLLKFEPAKVSKAPAPVTEKTGVPAIQEKAAESATTAKPSAAVKTTPPAETPKPAAQPALRPKVPAIETPAPNDNIIIIPATGSTL
ncbi:MAG: hypothetical protein HY888_08295 [Deltaproteobacteria bacterium]|nr:hypothetical protein [Deltaproteobacteria bacterium]